MSTTNIEENIWHWYHNISEYYYHIQLTIKYRKSLFDTGIEKYFLEVVHKLKWEMVEFIRFITFAVIVL